MKQIRIILPAVTIILISTLLALYSLFAIAHGQHQGPPSGGVMPQGGQLPPHDSFEPFKTLGTLAIVCGAVSFSWLRFKQKLASPSHLVRKLGKLLYKLHTWFGWAAVILIAVHGIYYLITKLHDDKIYSGLAAFLVLAGLALYGWLLKRTRNKVVRKVHFLLSLVWIPLLVLHAGGSVIVTAIVTAAVWVGVWVLEKTRTKLAVERA